MAVLIFVMVGLFLHFSQSMESQVLGLKDVVQVTGILGEELNLQCLYTGQNDIMTSYWSRVDSTRNEKKIAGYNYGGKTFSKDGFSVPASLTNLTVKVNISSIDMEGQYICVFSSDEDNTKDSFILTVFAQPEINIHLKEEDVNGTHFQIVSCSAFNAKPMAVITWQIRGGSLNEDIFSIQTINFTHPNGTASTISVLRFPIVLNNESAVTCVVEHPALTEPKMSEIKLLTFVFPNITMEMVLEQKEGKDFLQVICTAKGGRPHPEIMWILPASAHMPLSQKYDEGFESVSSSHWFASDLYEGENVTCIFSYPLLPVVHTRTVTLPRYYIATLQLKSSEMSSEKAIDLLILEEGERDVIISLEVMGNVPSYKINCTKNEEIISEDIDVIGSNILIKGPVGFNLSGQYKCQAIYYSHTAILLFNIEVNPKVLLPVTFSPNISVNLWKDAGNIFVECLAYNASPAANMSWVFPEGLNVSIQSSITHSNGSHTVQNILTLPACLSHELTIECVVEHVDLADQERRPIKLPTCVTTNITLQSSTLWRNGVAYIELNCSVDNLSSSASLSWDTKECRSRINASELSNSVIQPLQGDGVRVSRTAHLSVQAYAGCTVICVLEHQELEGPEQKSIQFPPIGPPEIELNIRPLRESTLWAAVCEYRGDGVTPNIYWVISDHNTTTAPASLQPTYEGIMVIVSATYEFQLSQHEGKDLTCVIDNNHGEEKRRTINVPKYFISSIVVLNKTSPLDGKHGQRTAVKRVALEEALPNQKIIFRVNGNTPAFSFKCFRTDGSAAHTDGVTLIFAEPVSEQDSGLYTCHASWYEHKATAYIQVDVTSQGTQILTFILICFSSAAAITLFLFITLCILCRRSEKIHSSDKGRKQRESLAGLMQTPYSPEFSKSALPTGKSSEYAELVNYSIVIDVKSTV